MYGMVRRKVAVEGDRLIWGELGMVVGVWEGVRIERESSADRPGRLDRGMVTIYLGWQRRQRQVGLWLGR